MIFRTLLLSFLFLTTLSPARACETLTRAQVVTPNTEGTLMPTGQTNPREQVQGDWQITQIGGQDVPMDRGLKMTFSLDGVEIFAGCNTVSATPRFGSNNFKLRVTSTTEKLCAPEVMELEAALIDALSKIDLLDLTAGNNLGFYNAMNELILTAARPAL